MRLLPDAARYPGAVVKRGHVNPGRRHKALKPAPHTQRIRALKLAERDADALAQVERARRTWDDVEPLEQAA